jgi:hypothetical protein
VVQRSPAKGTCDGTGKNRGRSESGRVPGSAAAKCVATHLAVMARGIGPAYKKFGAVVRYGSQEVDEYEKQCTVRSTREAALRAHHDKAAHQPREEDEAAAPRESEAAS